MARPLPGRSSPMSQSPAAPPSFKTNVNRNKTKKWAEAKQVNYDGDDWDGFDPYDEYGSNAGSARPDYGGMRQHSYGSNDGPRAFSEDRPPLRGESPNPRAGQGRPPPFRREFSQPSDVPPPLHTRPAKPPTRPDDIPLRQEVEGDDEKPAASIPFVRPSDIYKRMEQEKERERQSLDSSRPSVDSARSRSAIGAERIPKPSDAPQIPFLPRLESGGLDFEPGSHVPTSGLQSVVDRAFERQQNTSTSTGSDPEQAENALSRIDSSSTTGISPIIVKPTQTVSASTDRGRKAVPTTHPDTALTSSLQASHGTSEQLAELPSPPVPSGRAASPSRQASPARQSVITHSEKRLSGPMTAFIANHPTHAQDVPADARIAPSSLGSNMPVGEAVATELTGPHTRSARSGTPLASPVEGPKSPIPGRVRDLAGRYDEIQSQSRRNSQTSLASKSSFSSWSRSDDNMSFKRTRTGDSSLTGGDNDEQALASPTSPAAPSESTLQRPQVLPQPSFRPSLPGQWVSTADFRDNESSTSLALGAHQNTARPTTPKSEQAATDVDLTPRPAQSTANASDTRSSALAPVDALVSAGSALAASLMATTAASHETQDFAAGSKNEPEQPVIAQPKRAIGDVFLRPLAFDRTAESVASTPAPTPPAKDIPATQAGTAGQYFQEPISKELERADVSGDKAGEEEFSAEARELEREIVRSLTPRPEKDEQSVRDQDALDAPANLRKLQASEGIVPAPLQAPSSLTTSGVSGPAASTPPKSRPGLLETRFSWEPQSPPQPSGAFVDPSNLSREVDLPHSDLKVMNTETAESPKEDAATPTLSTNVYESPAQASESVVPPAALKEVQVDDDTSIARDREHEIIAGTNKDLPVPAAPLSTVDSEDEEAIGSNSAQVAPGTSLPPGSDTLSEPGAAPASSRIPPFRELMALKTAPQRIEAYNDTRKQFAALDTGLRNWLSATMSAQLEQGHLVNDQSSLAPEAGSSRHKSAPSFIKITKGRTASGQVDGITSPQSKMDGRDGTGFMSSPRSPQTGANMEKMQSMGKDLLSSAGKLGGKGVVGAKGWLAKGKQKLRDGSSGGGGDKSQDRSLSRSAVPIDETSQPDPSGSTADARAQTDRLPSTNRHSRSWSSHRLSATFDRIRNASERSHSRSSSRQPSVSLPSRSVTPSVAISSEDSYDPRSSDIRIGDPAEFTAPHGEDPVAMSSTWSANWEEEGLATPTRPAAHVVNTNRQEDVPLRLGILPSPGVETFAGGNEHSPGGTSPQYFGRPLHGNMLEPPRSIDRAYTGSETKTAAATPAFPMIPERNASLGTDASTADLAHTTDKQAAATVDEPRAPGVIDQRSSDDVVDAIDQQWSDAGMKEQAEKRDTPMLFSPEFKTQVASYAEFPRTTAKDPATPRQTNYSMHLVPVTDVRRASELSVDTTSQTIQSDISLTSDGVMEPPAHAEMARISTAKQFTVRNRSTPTSPQATPRAEVKEISFGPHAGTSAMQPENVVSDHDERQASERISQVSDHWTLADPVIRSPKMSDRLDVSSAAPADRNGPLNRPKSTVTQREEQFLKVAPAQSSLSRSSTVSDQIMSYYSQAEPGQAAGSATPYHANEHFSAAGPISHAISQDSSQPEHSEAMSDLAHDGKVMRDSSRPTAREAEDRQMRQFISSSGFLPPTGFKQSSYEHEESSQERPEITGRRRSLRFFTRSGRTEDDDMPKSERHRSKSRDPSRARSVRDNIGADMPARGKLVKKDRRASVLPPASPLETDRPVEKKKRFSGFGSLFGRNKTNVVETESTPVKRNRLSKQGPMLMGPTGAGQRKKGADPDAELMRSGSRRTSLVDDNSHPRSLAPLSRRSSLVASPGPPASENVPMPTHTMEVDGRWQQHVPREPTVPNIQPTRRLHSERSSRRFSALDPPWQQHQMSPIVSPTTPTAPSQQYPSELSRSRTLSPRQSNGRLDTETGHNQAHRSQNDGHGSAPRRVGSGLSLKTSGTHGQQQDYHGQRGQPVSATTPMSPGRNSQFSPVSANHPSPTWAEHGGYYIPERSQTYLDEQQHSHSPSEQESRSFTRRSSQRFSHYVTQGAQRSSPPDGHSQGIKSPTNTRQENSWENQRQARDSPGDMGLSLGGNTRRRSSGARTSPASYQANGNNIESGQPYEPHRPLTVRQSSSYYNDGEDASQGYRPALGVRI